MGGRSFPSLECFWKVGFFFGRRARSLRRRARVHSSALFFVYASLVACVCACARVYVCLCSFFG